MTMGSDALMVLYKPGSHQGNHSPPAQLEANMATIVYLLNLQTVAPVRTALCHLP